MSIPSTIILLLFPLHYHQFFNPWPPPRCSLQEENSVSEITVADQQSQEASVDNTTLSTYSN
jgi:hypothetical protein